MTRLAEQLINQLVEGLPELRDKVHKVAKKIDPSVTAQLDLGVGDYKWKFLMASQGKAMRLKRELDRLLKMYVTGAKVTVYSGTATAVHVEFSDSQVFHLPDEA